MPHKYPINKDGIALLAAKHAKNEAVTARFILQEAFGITKLSEAVQVMIDGLEYAAALPGFEVNMSSYGHRTLSPDNGSFICFGCAATGALLHLTQVPLPTDLRVHAPGPDEWYKASGLRRSHILTVEQWFDALRRGEPWEQDHAFVFCTLYSQWFPGADEHKAFRAWYETRPALPLLSTLDWESKLPAYRSYVAALQEHGW
jgi:hypothetical protein